MGRLFWKFFLAFWGCLLAAAAITGSTFWLLQPGPEDVQLAEGPRAQFLLDAAEVVINTRGPEGLRRMLDRLSQNTGRPAPVYAVNRQGKELLGRPLPEDLAQSFAKGLADRRPPQKGLVEVKSPEGEWWAVFILRPLRPPEEISSESGETREQTDLPRRRHTEDLKVIASSMEGFGLLVAGLSSLFFAGLLAYTYSRPFTKLKHAFGQAAKGKLSVRLNQDHPRKDEIGELLQGFDSMASQLQNQISQQKALLHDVSHELRSPLARLNLAAGLARQNPDRLDESLTRIEREAEKLDDLIGQLLHLSRLDSADIAAQFEPTDVASLLDEVLQDAQFEASQSGRRLVGEICMNSWQRPCSADALHSAFENIIRNALKFTPEGGQVAVRAEITSKDVFRLTVRDEGPGLPTDKLEQIFDPFFKQGQQAGHGLGLAIVKKSATIHSGTVHALNSKPTGLTIVFEIPKSEGIDDTA